MGQWLTVVLICVSTGILLGDCRERLKTDLYSGKHEVRHGLVHWNRNVDILTKFSSLVILTFFVCHMTITVWCDYTLSKYGVSLLIHDIVSNKSRYQKKPLFNIQSAKLDVLPNSQGKYTCFHRSQFQINIGNVFQAIGIFPYIEWV